MGTTECVWALRPVVTACATYLRSADCILKGFPIYLPVISQLNLWGVIMTHMWVSFFLHTGDKRAPSPGFHPLVYAYRTQHAPLFEVAKKAGCRAL